MLLQCRCESGRGKVWLLDICALIFMGREWKKQTNWSQLIFTSTRRQKFNVLCVYNLQNYIKRRRLKPYIARSSDVAYKFLLIIIFLKVCLAGGGGAKEKVAKRKMEERKRRKIRFLHNRAGTFGRLSGVERDAILQVVILIRVKRCLLGGRLLWPCHNEPNTGTHINHSSIDFPINFNSLLSADVYACACRRYRRLFSWITIKLWLEL